MIIASTQNPRIKWVRRLQTDNAFRVTEQLMIVEGETIIRELWHRRPHDLRCVLISERHLGADRPMPHWVVSDAMSQHVSGLAHPDGWLAVMTRPAWGDRPGPHDRLVVLDGIQSPRNVGAIMRSAIAFGFTGAIIGAGTGDPYHPEGLRGMVGHYDALTLYPDHPRIRQCLRDGQVQWVALDPYATQSIDQLTLHQGLVAVLAGSEGRGISATWAAELSAANRYRIPIQVVDSLNVGVATGIACYHVDRVLGADLRSCDPSYNR